MCGRREKRKGVKAVVHDWMKNIKGIVDEGSPVCITFLDNTRGDVSEKLFCEIITDARYGEQSLITAQRCRVGKFILGKSSEPPTEYYFDSGRYASYEIAEKAVLSLCRLEKEYGTLKIEPLSKNSTKFDLCILYLKPEKAMRIIQAMTYYNGVPADIQTLGAASVCSDCVAGTLNKGISLSFGCKGSRKHSKYSSEELPIGIRYDMLEKVEKALGIIPDTFD
jgi:uncharacterized protein (DUF169 family)